MYDFIVSFIGTLPTEFEFVYSILTLVMSVLILTFLFQVFYIPLKLLDRK